MLILRATQKVLNISGIKTLPVLQEDHPSFPLQEWYVSLASSSFKGKTFVIYVHAPSLITILVPGKSIKKTFPEFLSRLRALLDRFHFPESFIFENLKHTGEQIIQKTNSRSMLGFINEINRHLLYSGYQKETYQEINLDRYEEILMEHIYKVPGKSGKYYSPTSYWNNYFNKRDPYEVIYNDPNKIITLNDFIPGYSREENLMAENDVLKLQIESMGGFVGNTSGENIPPEIENTWLRYITDFEKLHKEGEKVKLYHFIGSPAYSTEAQLTDEEIETELDRLLELMANASLALDVVCEYPSRTIYKFITEELFEHEMLNMRLPGGVMHFIYEEFHPNHEYDLNRYTQEILERFHKTDAFDFLGEFDSELTFNNQLFDTKVFAEKMKSFNSRVKWEVMDVTINLIEFDLDEGIAHTEGKIEIVEDKAPFNISFELGFIHQYGYWYINKIDVPFVVL